MAVDASTVAAIVAIIIAVLVAAITLNAPSLVALRQIFRWIASFLEPTATTCPSLRWEDIRTTNPGIRLHDHKDTVVNCGLCKGGGKNPSFRHLTGTQKCWESSIALVFQSIWKEDRPRVPKPLDLAMGDEYLCTDMDVIVAYLLLTAANEPFQDKILGGWSKYLKLEKSRSSSMPRDLYIGHIGSPQALHRCLNLTVYELEKIKCGWPPHYRRKFMSFEGFELDNPVQSNDDIRRPGWLVSLGLGSIHPTAFYIEHDPTTNLFDHVRGRLGDMMTGKHGVLARWGNNHNVRSIVEDIVDILGGNIKQYSTGHNTFDLPELSTDHKPLSLQKLAKYNMKPLKREECEALMRMFNGSMLKFEGNDEVISVNVVQCMKRVKLAVWVALAYTKFNRQLIVPPKLEEQIVYLGPCPI